jgi:two-component system, NarL family, nitrate/nitrite response regulator NarL
VQTQHHTSLLIVEDHPLFRSGLVDLLVQAKIATEVHAVGTAAAALDLLNSNLDVDLVLADWRLPDMDGLSLFKLMATSHPTVARVLMSGTDDPRLPRSSQSAGLLGFLPKSLEPIELVEAIGQILNGSTCFAGNDVDVEALTPRQTEVLKGVAVGLTNKHIARKLGITERTVKHHLNQASMRLGTNRRSEAVSQALSKGLIALNE